MSTLMRTQGVAVERWVRESQKAGAPAWRLDLLAGQPFRRSHPIGVRRSPWNGDGTRHFD